MFLRIKFHYYSLITTLGPWANSLSFGQDWIPQLDYNYKFNEIISCSIHASRSRLLMKSNDNDKNLNTIYFIETLSKETYLKIAEPHRKV